MSKPSRTDWLDRLANWAFRSVISVMQLLPWHRRIAVSGWLFRRVVGPLGGFRRRAEDHLAMIYPDMPPSERRAIAARCLDNVGRTIIENYSPADQLRDTAVLKPEGPGWPAIEAARKSRKPIIFVSGHFGNWQVVRAALNQRGYDIGGLYRPFNNPHMNAHYVESIEQVGGRAYARSRRGLAAFLRTLKTGGQAAMLLDQYVADGALLDFMGKPALTSLSAAEMALRHDALLVPVYGIRQDDGLSFRLQIDLPVPHGEPAVMTQAVNDSLAARIHETPAQWFWMHRRWKPERVARKMRKRAAREAAAQEAAERD